MISYYYVQKIESINKAPQILQPILFLTHNQIIYLIFFSKSTVLKKNDMKDAFPKREKMIDANSHQ